MFKSLIDNFNKSRLLAKIAIEYETKNDINSLISNLVNNIPNKKDLLREDLFKMISKEDITNKLLRKYERNFSDVEKIVSVLELNGAGQIVKGHYVPLSVIAYPKKLDYLLKYWDGENFKVDDFDSHNSNLAIAFKMIESI